jgi:cell wall-associated NlpC family hydrolase
MRHALLPLACLIAFPCQAWDDVAADERYRPVAQALQAIGIKYRYGGRSPETGFDCSGLITYVFERAWGLLLPAGTEALSKVGTPVKRSELRPGDLVFYDTRGWPYSHVGIYLGEGRFLHAPRRGASVRVESLEVRYWSTRFDGARRLHPPSF